MQELICFDYQFHPVGQGLFASGALRTCPDGRVRFNWIYDCGTTSKNAAKIIDVTISRLKHDLQWQDHVDLLVLSHFDADHIGGVVKVLQAFRVEVLLLPYLSLEQRLMVAIDQNIDSDDAIFEFFVDPVQYLTDNAERGIGKILYVPPSNPDEGEQQFGNLTDGPSDPEKRPAEDDRFGISHSRVEGSEAAREDVGASGVEASANSAKVSVEFLTPRTTIQINALWEFFPYNDVRYTPTSSVFHSLVRHIARELLAASNPADRRKALDYLVAIYDEEFGTSSRMRNVISLFLYAGPIPNLNHAHILTCGWTWDSAEPIVPCICGNGDGCALIGISKCATLYTGDGYLNTPATLNALQSTLGADRKNQVAILQVMHHGAKGNWHLGVAAGIAPRFSIFSSDPHGGGFGHPHRSVWNEFTPYGAIQVDLNDGVGFCGAVFEA